MNPKELETLKTWMEKQFKDQFVQLKQYVDKKFVEQQEYIDKRSNAQDERLDVIDKRLTTIERSVRDMRIEMSTLNLRITELKVSQDVIINFMGSMKVEMEDLQKDVTEIRKNTEGLLQMMQDIMKDAITRQEHEKLEKRVVILEQL